MTVRTFGKRGPRRARLDLLGPLKLTDADGIDRTPRSPYRQALLGVVAVSGDTGVSRARLQDLFWSDKEPSLAAQSLRTALHGLRRDLSSFDGDLLEIGLHRVRLVPGAARVDLLALPDEGASALPTHVLRDPPDVMEGLDICAEGFEDWLRDMRMQWHDRIAECRDTTVALTPPATLDETPERDLRPVVGLLQPIVQARSIAAQYLCDALLDVLAEGLRDYVGARVFDCRDMAEGPEGLAVGASPDIYLRFRLYQIEEAVSLRVLVLSRSSNELLWSVQRGPIGMDRARIENANILGLLGEVIERVAATLAEMPGQGTPAPIAPVHALTSMFRLEHASLNDLHDALTHAWDETNAPIYPALLAYLNTFRVGEHWYHGGPLLSEETRQLVSAVRRSGLSGGLAHGLAGHAAGYVLHDHHTAGEMLDRALKMAPQSAFCWDHLALHCTYDGRYDTARVASRNALRLGAFSPIEFTMQTTRSMIATLQGDFATATDLGARVLSRRPTFGAALRYMSIGMAHQGDIDGARACVLRIRELDPTFSVEWVEQDRMAVRDRTAKGILTDGLKKAGAT